MARINELLFLVDLRERKKEIDMGEGMGFAS